MSILVLITIVLATSGACFGLTQLAYTLLPKRRIREEQGRKLKGPAFLARCGASMIVSTALIYATIHFLGGRLFYEGPVSFVRGAGEALCVLVLYDFLYYFLHRYPFHQWSVLQRVHAVHHRARHPIAVDSLYLHPVENVLGLALLLGCTWVVGPVNVYAFAACFFVYSWLNILVHAGVDLPIVGVLSRKHDTHHTSMRAGNFASLTPLPDLIFGTAE